MSVRTTVRVSAAVVSVATFILLYFGLVDLARLSGITDLRAWLYPLAIDGMVAAAYAATLSLSDRALWYAWAVVAVGSGMSLVGQWLHASALSEWAWAGPVAAAPALSMSLVWHLMWLVLKREDVAVPTPQVEVQPEPSPEPQKPVTRPQAAPRRVPRGLSPDKQRAVAILTAAKAEGVTLTGAEMARRLGLENAETDSGRRSGQRWLRRAEEALAA